MAEPDELEDEIVDDADSDLSTRRQVGWVFLAGAILTGALLVYNVFAGVVYGRSGEVRHDTDPQGFWFMVCGYGLCALMMLFAFAASRIGDGGKDD